MQGDRPPAEPDPIAGLTRGVRLDLVVALCALLISSVAAGASWWQARVLEVQTNVLEQQLGAQVWPYVRSTQTIEGDTARLSVSNDGLGPAILRSATITVDGTPKHGLVDMLHAVLGPDVISREPHGEKIGVDVNDLSAGTVLRAGTETVVFALRGNHLAARFMRVSYGRIEIRVCYCAIVPDKCWRTGSADPQPVSVCPAIPGDLLHVTSFHDIFRRKF